MTVQELQVEIASLKAMVAQLQASVNHLSAMIESEYPEQSVSGPMTKWLSLAGVGAELWQTVDVDAYINEQRDSWS